MKGNMKIITVIILIFSSLLGYSQTIDSKKDTTKIVKINKIKNQDDPTKKGVVKPKGILLIPKNLMRENENEKLKIKKR